MVFAVRCPSSRCRKFMLVEPADRGTVIPCLVCKQPVKVPAAPGEPTPAPIPVPAPPPPAPPPPAAEPPLLLDEYPQLDQPLVLLDDAPAGLPVAKPLPPG